MLVLSWNAHGESERQCIWTLNWGICIKEVWWKHFWTGFFLSMLSPSKYFSSLMTWYSKYSHSVIGGTICESLELCKCSLWFFFDHDDINKFLPLEYYVEFWKQNKVSVYHWVGTTCMWFLTRNSCTGNAESTGPIPCLQKKSSHFLNFENCSNVWVLSTVTQVSKSVLPSLEHNLTDTCCFLKTIIFKTKIADCTTHNLTSRCVTSKLYILWFWN